MAIQKLVWNDQIVADYQSYGVGLYETLKSGVEVTQMEIGILHHGHQ